MNLDRGYRTSSPVKRSGYVTDYCNYNASGVVLHVGGNYNQNPNHGLFYLNGNNAATNANANIGSRHHCKRVRLPVKSGAVVAEHLLKISCDRAQAGTPGRAKERLRGYNGEPYEKNRAYF